jgi:drug/metabolite transporter (DMT)-like permease
MAVSAIGATGGGWTMPCWHSFLLLVMMGICSAGGQILFTYALKFTSAIESSVFSQIGVVWTYLGQVVLWDEELKLTSGIGALLLISSGVYLGYMLERKRPIPGPSESPPSSAQ